MGDLWSDDIENEKALPDAAILRSIRALIAAEERETTILDSLDIHGGIIKDFTVLGIVSLVILAIASF